MSNSDKKTEVGFNVGGNWEKRSVKLKEKYDQLADSDLKFEAGKENDMLGRVQKKLNKNREEVIKIINDTQVHAENGHAKDAQS